MIVGSFSLCKELQPWRTVDYVFDPKKKKIKSAKRSNGAKKNKKSIWERGAIVTLFEEGLETGPKVFIPLPQNFPNVVPSGNRYFIGTSELTDQRIEDKLLVEVMGRKCTTLFTPYWVVDEETRRTKNSVPSIACIEGKKELSDEEREAIKELAADILMVLTSEKLRKVSAKKLSKVQREVERRIRLMKGVPKEWCEDVVTKKKTRGKKQGKKR